VTEILDVQDVHVSYGPIRAVRGVSFTVNEGETVAVVGANGAGKTTLMQALCNAIPSEKGVIRYLGQSTANERPDTLARKGLLHIPEGRGTLGKLSVLDNLRLAFDRAPANEPGGFAAATASVFERFPRLAERQRQRAGDLSGGEQQMLALARAVVNRPRLLLIDEPSLGLSPLLMKQVFSLLRLYQKENMTILLVEQNARAALRLAHRGYVLRQGEIAMKGDADVLAADPKILEYYLGA